MKILTFAQGSDEWLAARLGLATASCFDAILAKGKGSDEAVKRRDYRLRLVVERLTGKGVEGFKSAAMQQGTEREPLARAAYESRTGAFVESVGMIRHDELEAAASPDGLIDKDGGVEIKCPELAAHLEYLRLPANTAPSKYIAQIQGQMWIAERQWIDFASFNPDFPENLQLAVRRVRRDEKYIAQLEFMVRAFLGEVAQEEAELRAMPLAA